VDPPASALEAALFHYYTSTYQHTVHKAAADAAPPPPQYDDFEEVENPDGSFAASDTTEARNNVDALTTSIPCTLPEQPFPRQFPQHAPTGSRMRRHTVQAAPRQFQRHRNCIPAIW